MATVTIPQTMSGTRSIYDLGSAHYDRVIEFGPRDEFAVVLPDHYGAWPTVHGDLESALEDVRDNKDCNPVVIARNGEEYTVQYGCELEATGNHYDVK